jgi:hypothetical protein
MSTKAIPTRPARPGDILSAGETTHGVRWQIHLAIPLDHPARGVATDVPAVRVRGTLMIPGKSDIHQVCAPFVARDVDVLGPKLYEGWGTGATLPEGYYRIREEYVTGESIAPLVREMQNLLSAEAAMADAIASAHFASVAQLASRRAAACEAYPVPDINP